MKAPAANKSSPEANTKNRMIVFDCRYLCKSISDLTVVGFSSSLSVVDSSTHAASIFSLANGMVSIKVCIGVLP